mgnify:CR=1 FL=1
MELEEQPKNKNIHTIVRFLILLLYNIIDGPDR